VVVWSTWLAVVRAPPLAAFPLFFLIIFFISFVIYYSRFLSLRVGVGLVGAIVVGPRMGRFDSAQKVPASDIR
jgi:hypothetical protein